MCFIAHMIQAVVFCKRFVVDCCVCRRCWCFTTHGLCTVGQDEVVIVLEQLPREDDIPCDVLVHILLLYNRAAQGLSFSAAAFDFLI